ncbi:MAG: flagellar protein FliT [Lachnospiraceae bacterium]|nr:flagellar protein FliT [Lachnospiraceae bacterium]
MEKVSNYLKVLEESLSKKLTVLQALLEASNRQGELAEEETFDLDLFETTMDQKEELLSQLEKLDEGFDSVFRKIETEVKENKEFYKEEVLMLQQLIRQCTDVSVEIQAAEARNKAKLSVKFSDQQKELRQIKTSNKVATTYYKSMTNTQDTDSYYMDQKK